MLAGGNPLGPILVDDDVADILGAFDAAVEMLRRVGGATALVSDDDNVLVVIDRETFAMLRQLAGRIE